MQTSQVMNPVNAMSSPAPAARPSDANSSSEAFGQVLSREVANRQGANEAPTNTNTSNANTAAHSPKNEAKAADASSRSANKADEQAGDEADAPATTTSLPDEMLALVANFAPTVKLPVKADGSTSTDSKDTASPIDAIAIAVGSAGTATSKVQIPAADIPVTATADGAALPVSGAERRISPTSRANTSALAGDNTKQGSEMATAQKADLASAASALDFTSKGKEPSHDTLATSSNAANFANEIKESITNVQASLQQIQPSALHAAQTAANHPADQLSPRVGTPAWDQALGQKIVWMVAGEQQSASLTLNPPDLGPLQVVLNVSNSQASATFTAAQPEVRQALEAALPKLRDMLGDAGIQLGQATVNSGTPNQHSAPDQHNAHPTHRVERADNRDEAPARVSRVQTTISGTGLVDTFV